jgi:NAD(P)H-dependent flavin oxidoreductase YrpB (nitropropane dioxygenase family)
MSKGKFALGAEGVQIGTRFALSKESSAHPDFKIDGKVLLAEPLNVSGIIL